MFSLLRAAFLDTSIPETVPFETFSDAYALATQHDLAHVLYVTLDRQGRLPTAADDTQRACLEKAKRAVMVTQFRYVKLEAELEHVHQVLESACIPHVPMKGSVMRVQKLYFLCLYTS